MAEGDDRAALAYIQNAELIHDGSAAVHIAKGQGLLRLKHWSEAEEAFRKALKIDPTSARAYAGLARSLLPRRRKRSRG